MQRTGLISFAIVAALVSSSCFESGTETCLSGRVCPGGSRCAANQDICIRTLCGNGVVDEDTDEVCDDGNVENFDGCREDCLSDGGCGNGVLDPREACDYAMDPRCRADCSAVLGCGNGFLDLGGGEECDEGDAGNWTDGGCPNCRSAFCGDYFADERPLPDGGPRERCDDGPAGSSTCNPANSGLVTCLTSTCGDRFTNAAAGEECDTGGIDTTACDRDCTLKLCGDGHVNDAGGEICDDTDGGLTSCPYDQTCSDCNATCTGRVVVRGPYCGDGIRQDAGFDGGVEACDDGNDAGETSCPYGAPGGNCTACSADCSRVLNLTGPYCGDGNVDVNAGSEACDDGNSDSCGTCSADCRRSQSGAATGRIIAVHSSKLRDGEGFTLDDGLGPLYFEFDFEDGTLPDGGGQSFDAGAVPVMVAMGDNANTVAATISGEIISTALNITPTRIGSQVNLSNGSAGALGNRLITETVQDPGFFVEGMSGGGGQDCPADTGCTSDQDCMSPLTCPGSAGSRICR